MQHGYRPPPDRGQDVLRDPHRHHRPTPDVTLRRGLVVEVLGDGFVGAVVAASATTVDLEDRRGRRRTFRLEGGGFVVDDEVVRLVPPARRPPAPPPPATTASGSLAVDTSARVARASRILVEGVHDAEILERVWGDDLRVEGLVVEVLEGIDDLETVVAAFRPTADARLGVLVDHLVPGSKEQRIVSRIRHPHVLVTGHPFVDVWAAVKPDRVGLEAWPDIPRDVPWKEGIAAALGRSDPTDAWRHVLASISTWTDLDRSLVGAVEALIDFCTAGPEAG